MSDRPDHAPAASGAWPEPAAVELSSARVGDAEAARLMVVLRAPGCSYARRPGGGCTNCGFEHLTTRGQPVSSEDLLEQLRRACARHAVALPRVRQLDLFCSGSFLCDDEIAPDARRLLLAGAARQLPALRRLLVESRPELVTASGLEAARDALTRAGCEARIELAIGLESADRAIREQRVRKGFTLAAFERAARRTVEAGVGLVVYLLLKPIDTGEAEAVQDVLRSGRYLVQLAGRLGASTSLRVALEPTFVPEGTPLHRELLAGRYAPPSLWSVIEATRGLAAQGLTVRVGLSDEGLPVQHAPAGCRRCTGPLRAALARFNATQDPADLAGLDCDCRRRPGPNAARCVRQRF